MKSRDKIERRFSIRGRELTIEAPLRSGWSVRGEGIVTIEIDGQERVVEILESGPHHLDLVIDGHRHLFSLASGENKDELWIGTEGCVRLVTTLEDRRPTRGPRGGRGAGVGGRKVTPSFPATVVKLLVEVGEAVAHGHPLVVVSAMKMEMTLTAPHDGVVRQVNVEIGQNVSPGDELVVVEELGQAGGDDDE